MALKYLATGRLQGTTAERTALTISSQITQETGGANQTVFGENNEAHYGIYLESGSALIGATVSKVAFHVKQNVNPSTENKVFCRLWRDGAFIHTFGEADPDDINIGSYEWHTFGTGGDDDAGNGTSVALEEDDAILLSWDRVSGNSTWLGIEYSSSNQYDGTNTGVAVANGSNTNAPSSLNRNSGRDVMFRLTHISGYPNLPNGAIFEDSSDGKHYMFDGTSAWNEMI